MKRFTFLIFIMTMTLLTGNAMAGKPGGDIPITQQISDYDVNAVAYSIQSDGLGDYTNTVTTYKGKTTGIYSVLMSNTCNGQTNGDRLLDRAEWPAERMVKITLDSTNAIMPGDPNYLVPSQLQGTITSGVRSMNTCTCDENLNMYKMAAGTKIFCPMHFKMYAPNYRLDMRSHDEPETEKVQIVCNAADSSGCKDWDITPITDPDYTLNPGKTRARLINLNNGQNMGNFYMTFHLHVTRP